MTDIPSPLGSPTHPCTCKPLIIVHGGAGTILHAHTEAAIKAVRNGAAAGYAVLKAGGTALDAVQAAVMSLEDDPSVNAGRGSVLTSDGTIELDASIMRGADLAAGAISGLPGRAGVRNPVALARAVMEKTPHCLLTGDGAVRFAKEIGVPTAQLELEPRTNPFVETRVELVDPDYHMTEKSIASLHRHFATLKFAGEDFTTSAPPSSVMACAMSGLSESDGSKVQQSTKVEEPEGKYEMSHHDGHDTVGAVAIDCYGRLAAATSTGGMTGKRPGRVGDSPIVGSGIYADDESCAISSTGHGESFIKTVFCMRVMDQLRELTKDGRKADDEITSLAVQRALDYMKNRVGGKGGAICISKDGGIGWARTSEHMAYALVDKNGVLTAGITGPAHSEQL